MPTIADSLKKIVHWDCFLESTQKRLAGFIQRKFVNFRKLLLFSRMLLLTVTQLHPTLLL